MKTRLLPLIVLALATIPCDAQSVFTPFSWSTIAGDHNLILQINGYGGFADGTNSDAQFGAPYSVAVDASK